MSALQLSYKLNPPASTPLPSLPPTAQHSYPLNDATPQQQLVSLETALGKARETLNSELTVWKEAVKGLELEVKKKKKSSEEDEDGEDEEEDLRQRQGASGRPFDSAKSLTAMALYASCTPPSAPTPDLPSSASTTPAEPLPGPDFPLPHGSHHTTRSSRISTALSSRTKGVGLRWQGGAEGWTSGGGESRTAVDLQKNRSAVVQG